METDTMTLNGLREEKSRLLAMADQVLVEGKRDGKSLSSEDSAKFDKIFADVESLHNEIAKREKLDAFRVATVAEKHETEERAAAGDAAAKATLTAKQELNTWLRTGLRSQPGASEVRSSLENGNAVTGMNMFTVSMLGSDELRAMATTSSTNGQKAIPPGFVASCELARLAFGDVRRYATILRTARGNNLLLPVSNDTGNSGRLLAENTAATATDIAISNISLDAYKYSSDAVLVSVELLQDEDIDLESQIGEQLGERLGRITNAHFTTGTGSSQPNGIVTAATSGLTAAGTTAVTYAELVNLQHSVDPAYQEGASWMFNFTVLGTLKKLVDGQSRPLWMPLGTSGMAGAYPETLLGKPVIINQQMPAMTTGLKPILYGNISKYIVREVKDVTFLRLAERWADQHSVGFLAFMRTDGDLKNAGTNPVKVITMA